jgi:hypothetical protein
MSLIETLNIIRLAHGVAGSKVLAEASGVPRTTVDSLAFREFNPKTVEILSRLESAAIDIVARSNEASTLSPDGASLSPTQGEGALGRSLGENEVAL